jgi:mannosylglycerate hydrolase
MDALKNMPIVHIVPHTHWDREWYRPFQYFRIKLVYVVDSLLDMLEKDDHFISFLLDGQTVVLEDYLAIKPENTGRLKALIAAGRIQVGPWYIQPGEFSPDGESLVRNILIGKRIAEEFGKSMMVGYLPDSFGHSGQMPHILNGFGITSAVVMRGVAAEEIKSTEFEWVGVNGDKVLSVFLPRGYSNGMFLPQDYRSDKYRLRFMVRRLKKWTSTRHTLIMNGVDHQFPQAHIPDHIARLNAEGKNTTYRISTLAEYIHAVAEEHPNLPILKGDLLTPSRNRVHSSAASTRIYQKQKNRRMEALLEKYVEPIAAIGWLKHAEYPSGLINQAWKTLLQNQTHDGICGVCLDEVHREMDQRFVDVKNIGVTIRNTYARAIARRISCDQLSLAVFNNAMTQGVQSVKAIVYTKKTHFTLKDQSGNLVPFQIDQVEDVDISENSIWTLYLNTKEMLKKIEITFSADFDFNVGYKVYTIHEGVHQPKIESGLIILENGLENSLIKMTINRNGSIDLLDKQTGHLFSGLHIFEDCGDAGDTYNYSPVKMDTVITSQDSAASYVVTQEGPLKAQVCIQLQLTVPLRLEEGDQARTAETVHLPITTTITMTAGQKRLDFSTEVDNTAFDHRLRVLFPTNLKTDVSYAETQFGTITRAIRLDNADWKKRKWHEKPLPIYPHQKFVDLNDGTIGLAVMNRGLSEYEIYDRENASIAITLIRGVGMMGKRDLLIRPGRPSGISKATPDAQCLGIQTLEYALFPHSGGLDQENIPKQAAMYDASPLAVQSHLQYKKLLKRYKLLLKFISLETLTSHIYDQLDEIEDEDMRLIELTDERLIISAVKKAEQDNTLIIRFYNGSSVPVENASIKMGIRTERASLTDFNEQEIRPLTVSDLDVYTLPVVRPNSAVTTRICLPGNYISAS